MRNVVRYFWLAVCFGILLGITVLASNEAQAAEAAPVVKVEAPIGWLEKVERGAAGIVAVGLLVAALRNRSARRGL